MHASRSTSPSGLRSSCAGPSSTPATDMAPERLAVVGTGLIGASVGLAAKRAGVERVTGWDADPESLALAGERGAVDESAASVEEAVGEAELAIVATPVAALAEQVEAALAAGPATVT